MSGGLRRAWQTVKDVGGTWGLAVLLVAAGIVAAYQFVGPPPPDRIVMATGQPGGAYQRLGNAYAAVLARDGITLELRSTAGSVDNLALLKDLRTVAGHGAHPDVLQRAGAEDRTGGLTLRLLSKSEDGAATLYRVRTDGTLAFGGGFAALIDKTEWSGAMTGEEIDRLGELVDALEPRELAAPVEEVESTVTRTLEVRRPGGFFEVLDTSDRPEMVALQELLDGIRLRRYEPIIDALPKAGAQE